MQSRNLYLLHIMNIVAYIPWDMTQHIVNGIVDAYSVD
jgi:hypothetical protein